MSRAVLAMKAGGYGRVHDYLSDDTTHGEVKRKSAEIATKVMGMAIDIPKEERLDLDQGADTDQIKPTKKMPERKTKQERVKAEKRRAEVRLIYYTKHRFYALLSQCCRNEPSPRQ